MILMALVVSASVALAEQTVKHDDWAGGAADMLGVTKVDLDGEESAPKRHISLSCTDENGTRLKKGESGYEDCLRRTTQKQGIQSGG